MKFNEKLIELRKKEGLSQEELGYKLNVTRQTVSKWELGQTTPEMDKLLEMSKIFNISVDELINESETQANPNPIIEDQPIVEKNTKEKNIKIIIVVALIIVIVLILLKLFASFSIFNKITDTQGNIFDKFFSIFEQATNNIEESTEKYNEKYDETQKKIAIRAFNGSLEIFNGTNMGRTVKEILDNVITSNKTQDKKITVKYNETETQDSEEIKNLKTSFDDTNNFEVSFEYDEEGYINEVIIEKVVSQFEVSKFNNSLEICAGTTMGGTVTHVLDNIITSNKTEERKITVKYNETETQNETEIKSIKQNIGTFNNYEITFEYDADGFINKAIIEKL